MPLTKTGLKIKRRFKIEYGKKKGERVFYSYIKAHPVRTKRWHRKRNKNGSN